MSIKTTRRFVKRFRPHHKMFGAWEQGGLSGAVAKARLKKEAEEAEKLKAAEEGQSDELEMEEGETLEDIKARMSAMKPKKPTISADMLNTANTYDDKVALIRMIVSEENTRARMASVLKNMIRT